MKKIISQLLFLALLASGLFIGTNAYSQVPQKFNYQGIARDVKGNPMGKLTLALKLSVLPTEDATVAEYEETQMVTTNEFGLYTLQIGNGTALTGDIKTVKWETGNKYIKVAIDPKGGNDYQVIGTSQLLSVPYAIYADKAGLARETVGNDGKTRTGAVSSHATHVAGDANYIPKFTALNVIGKSLIYDNGTRVGIGTSSPLASGLLHLKSTTGTQPLILESPQGVHNLIQENGLNRGYFGSYIGSGGAYPTPAGTTDADFDIGTSGANPTGKLHLATQTTPRMTIDPSGQVGINLTNPSAIFQVNKSTDPTIKLSNSASGTTATDGLDITLSGNNATLNNKEAGSVAIATNNTSRLTVTGTGDIGIGTNTPATKLHVNGSVYNSGPIFMHTVGSSNPDRMLVAHSPAYTDYGIQYQDVGDKMNFVSGGTTVLGVDLGTNRVGIGTANPSTKLDIVGNIRIADGTQGAGKVLTSNASGVATWQTLGAGGSDWTMNGNDMYNNNTGNVGIGNPTPSYKLDLLHSGSTGILCKSSGNFSIIDIDGQNGDAAIRFAKAGVNQWNMRNRPGDDYFEIYELGGGGSRMVIQDGTGNVGIGETISPSYKLDILHGGSTGTRVKSSSSFSIVDIDAESGDAAIRFAKAGVNQWNIRNNPGSDDYQIYELGGGGERMRIDNTTGKVWVNGDFTALGVKAFTMDHPLDPLNKTLAHAAIESNEVLNAYSGNAATDANGKATIQLPDYFEAINKDFRYQLTVIGSFAQAIISKEIANNQFEISSSVPNVKISWQVIGVRNDAHMKKMPFVAVQEKPVAQKGKYVDPVAYDQPETSRVSYSESNESSIRDVEPKTAPVKKEIIRGGSVD